MFSALSENHGNLRSKLHNFVALCPIINLGWSQDPLIVYGANNYDFVNSTLSNLHLIDIPSPGHVSSTIYNAVCKVINCKIFNNVAQNIFGENSPYDRNDRAIVLDKRSPSDSSAKQIQHFAQSKRDMRFAQFDYGPDINMLEYGQLIPPELDIGEIKGVHIAMFVGDKDTWSVIDGAKWALQKLPKDTDYFQIKDWDHMSFGVGKDMTYFNDVLKQLYKYNPLPDYVYIQ